MTRGALAIGITALLLTTSVDAHARRAQGPNVNGPMPGAGGPKGIIGKTARFGMRATGRIGQLAGIGGMIVGAATLNPFIFGGGMLVAGTGTIMNRGARRWGDPSVGMPRQKEGNILGRSARFGMRTTGRLTKWLGIGGVIAGIITLNPFLIGAGAAAGVGGHFVKKGGEAGPGFGFGQSAQLQQPGGMADQAGQYQFLDYDGDGRREGRMEMPGGFAGANPAMMQQYPGFGR